MPTKAELKRQLTRVAREASAYQEAFWALRRGETPRRVVAGPHAIELLALGRHCGGVVLEGSLVTFADEWIGRVDDACDAWTHELVRRIRRLQADALDERLAEAERQLSRAERAASRANLRVVPGGAS